MGEKRLYKGLRMMRLQNLISIFLLLSIVGNAETWRIDSNEEWVRFKADYENLSFDGGTAVPSKETSYYRSIVRTYDSAKKAKSLTLKQSPVWHNWNSVGNIGPVNLLDAPVLPTLGPGDYWMFGRYGQSDNKVFKPKK